MIQRQLSKAQGYVVERLATESMHLEQRLLEARAAVDEHAELLRQHYELPEGRAVFRQTQTGWAIVVQPTEDAAGQNVQSDIE